MFTGEEKIELDKVQTTKNEDSCELKMNKTCKKSQNNKKKNRIAKSKGRGNRPKRQQCY